MTQQKNIYHQSKSTIKKEESILKAATTNPAKFAPIYEKYYVAIFKFVLQRVENEQVASEIVSDVFAKAIFNLKKYKFKGYPFSAWLYRVAYNEIATKFRKKQKQRTVNIPDESWNLFSNDEDEENDIAIDLQKLKICLPKLKPNEIELIEMRFFEKRSFKEIAEITGVTENNAKVKVYRTIDKIKKNFNIRA